MKARGLLAAFFLAVGLCLVPALGYGEVKEWMDEAKASFMRVVLQENRVNYMMSFPDTFLWVNFFYDPTGEIGRRFFPRDVETKGKIIMKIKDIRNVFFYEFEKALLEQFEKELENIYSYSAIELCATNMNTDIVAEFRSREGIPLGYFYQGEYHLWGSNAGNVCFEAARHM